MFLHLSTDAAFGSHESITKRIFMYTTDLSGTDNFKPQKKVALTNFTNVVLISCDSRNWQIVIPVWNNYSKTENFSFLKLLESLQYIFLKNQTA